MADVGMKDFLLQYYMQLRFNLMPAEVRAQYDVYVKSNDFRGNMKSWKNKLMHDDGTGRFVQNGLPDPNGTEFHLTDAEWEKLFKAYQSALRGMAAARANGDESITENNDVVAFIDEYFGSPNTHLFSNAQIVFGYDSLLDNVNTVFNNHPQLEYVLHQGGYTEPSFSDIKRGIASRKYNSDPNFQSQIIKIVGFLAWKITEDTNVANWFNAYGLGSAELENIYSNAFADTTIDPNKLEYFKRNHQSILDTLYKKDKIFNVFRNYDNGKISSQIAKARENLKYDDQNSDDYVPPKRDDQLTPMQQLSKWADDTYDNLLDKYLKFHGDRLYFSKNAENIIKAINGAKIKPTDGIDGILSKSGDIKKNLLYKSPTATKHFDWFTKTLGEIKSTMKKAFEGALKNGRQMRAIVSEIIIKAVRDGKTDEAKTALEVLSIIKYGATTSKVMDALKKENLTIFSDGKLSWNKNDGVKFVTNALDKSIKTAFMGIGYGITIIGNEIRLSGSKFNGNRGRIQHAQQTWSNQTAQERQTRENERIIRDNDAQNTIAQLRTLQQTANPAQWQDAEEQIQELNNQIAARDTELANWDNNHKDKYMELMAYWDMLETGRDSHMGKMYNWLPRSKKSAQAAFNSQKDNIINNYLNGYSYVA